LYFIKIATNEFYQGNPQKLTCYFSVAQALPRGSTGFSKLTGKNYLVGIDLKRLHWTLLGLLLFTPLAINLAFVSDIHNFIQKIFIRYRFSPANILLKDILFIEGFFLVIFGLQSGEYIWNYFRNRNERGLREQPTEFGVGIAFLAVGVIYISSALIIP
jgi:hypothetical protein